MPVPDGFSMIGLVQFTPGGAALLLQDTGGGDWVAPDEGHVRIFSTLPVWIKIGVGVVASVQNEHYMPANFPQDFAVRLGDTISVIAG